VIMIKVTTKKAPASVTLTINVDEQFITPYKQAVLKRLKKDLKIAGFRPGMAPDNIAEKELGEARVQAEVLEEVIMHAYSRGVRDEKLETVASPKITLKKFVPYTDLEFEAEAPIMPKISIDLTKLKVKKPEAKVEDKEVEETLKGLQKQSAKKTEKTGKIVNDDEVTFDFTGVREGKPVEGASATGHVLVVGSKQFIPGFEENLVGLKAGDKKTFTITFPKDYHAKDLAGKDVEFSVDIHKVTGVDLPKMDDDWAKTVGPVKDLAALKKDVKETLVSQKQGEAIKAYENQVLEAVTAMAKFEVPAGLVDEQAAHLRKETEENLKNSGLDIDKYLEIQKRSKEEFEKELRTESEKRVKLGLILRYVIEKEKITVSDAEVQAEIQQLKEQYTDPKMLEHIEHDHFADDIKNHLLTTKAVGVLVAAAAK
jgi:trigger factor